MVIKQHETIMLGTRRDKRCSVLLQKHNEEPVRSAGNRASSSLAAVARLGKIRSSSSPCPSAWFFPLQFSWLRGYGTFPLHGGIIVLVLSRLRSNLFYRRTQKNGTELIFEHDGVVIVLCPLWFPHEVSGFKQAHQTEVTKADGCWRKQTFETGKSGFSLSGIYKEVNMCFVPKRK